MDRYVIREPRAGVDYPDGNQMISFPATNTGNASGMPQNMYYAYGPENQGYMSHMPHGSVITPAQTFGSNFYQNQGQMLSGIDPHYLAGYADNNISFIATGQRESQSTSFDVFGAYQNRNFVGPDRNEYKYYPQRTPNAILPETIAHPKLMGKGNTIQHQTSKGSCNSMQLKQTEADTVKKEEQVLVKTPFEKNKELHKIGTRVFCGPVEKILKWNKSIQDIGAIVLYEVVGKCTSVRPGERCAKNLVVRDEGGPAMQVVYYEIDLLLPELTLPCTVRVVGRMLSGSSRMQAFSVRIATTDDVTALSLRSTVAAHHVAELCKQYGGYH